MTARASERTARAQRGYAHVRDIIDSNVHWAEDLIHDTPVLVVPEASVSRCRHRSTVVASQPVEGGSTVIESCRGCGAIKEGAARWQRPRILRPVPA